MIIREHFKRTTDDKVVTFEWEEEESGHMYRITSIEAKDEVTGKWYILQRTQTLLLTPIQEHEPKQ